LIYLVGMQQIQERTMRPRTSLSTQEKLNSKHYKATLKMINS